MNDFILNSLEHQDGDKYIVGHKFGGDHPQTHWVKNPRARKFSTSTTENESEGFIFEDKEKAFQHINKKVSKFNLSEEHYSFHAVIKNIRNNKEGVWPSSETK